MGKVYLKVNGKFDKDSTVPIIEVAIKNFVEHEDDYEIASDRGVSPVRILKKFENKMKYMNLKFSIFRIIDESDISENIDEMKNLVKERLLEKIRIKIKEIEVQLDFERTKEQNVLKEAEEVLKIEDSRNF